MADSGEVAPEATPEAAPEAAPETAPEAQPEFEFASLDMIRLAPGRGNFTCCARNHQLPEGDVFTVHSSAGGTSGGGGTVVCDKIKIAVVLDTMVRGED